MSMQSFITWVVAVLCMAGILSATNRYCLSPHGHPDVQWAIWVGSLVSIALFPFYRRAHLEPGQLIISGIFVGGLGITVLSSSWLPEGVRMLPQRLARWLQQNRTPTPARHEEDKKEGQEKSRKAIPESKQGPIVTSIKALESSCAKLDDGQVPVEVRMELSWLYLEQGRFEEALRQARLALAENVLLGHAETTQWRRWLRYLHCYQAVRAEEAYHLDKERTCAQLRELAWERHQQREEFWRESV